MSPRRAFLAACTGLLFLAACGDDSPVGPTAPGNPDAVIQGLAHAYRSRNIEQLEVLVARDPARNAEFQFVSGAPEVGESSWGWEDEKLTHQRLFALGDSLPGGGSIPPNFRVRSIEMTFERLTPLSEPSDLYSRNGGADGKLDSAVWRAFAATYRADITLHVASDVVLSSSSEQSFVVIEDRTLRPGSAGKFLLLRWEDLCRHGPGVQPVEFCWTDVLSFYRPEHPPGHPPGNPEDAIRSLEQAYEARDLVRLQSVLAHYPGRNAEFTFVPADSTLPSETPWGYDTEVALHRRMFRPEDSLPGESPVPPELWLRDVEFHVWRQTGFWERPDLYSANGGADGKLDPTIWKAMEAYFVVDALFETAEKQYHATSGANVVTIEDLSKPTSDPHRFSILRWEDLCPPIRGDEKGKGPTRPTSTPPKTPPMEICWSEFKSLYLPTAAPVIIDSPEALIRAFTAAYAMRDYDRFRSLLAHDPARNADYLFFLGEPTPGGETSWGYTEEARIHQRMFEPQNTPPGDPPVPPERWLSSISINLAQLEPFQERTDLYSAGGGADGKLDPAIWSALDARYGANVFFDTQGENSTDFQVTGEANFVVIEDKSKEIGDPGKFLIYIWEDLQSPVKPGGEGSASKSWSSIKLLYK